MQPAALSNRKPISVGLRPQRSTPYADNAKPGNCTNASRIRNSWPRMKPNPSLLKRTGR